MKMTLGWLAAVAAVAALCLLPLAKTAYAQVKQSSPVKETVVVSGGESEASGDADLVDDTDDMDLEFLAADVDDGHGPGAGAHGMHMGAGMGPGGHGMMRMGGGMDHAALREKLNLTDDQKSKMADIHDRQARRAIPIEADLRISALDMHKLMRADKPDQRAIEAQIDKTAGLRASLQKSRVAVMLEAHAILTPVQLKLLREAHGGMMRGMMGGRMGMGHGMGAGMDGGPMERKVNVHIEH